MRDQVMTLDRFAELFIFHVISNMFVRVIVLLWDWSRLLYSIPQYSKSENSIRLGFPSKTLICLTLQNN